MKVFEINGAAAASAAIRNRTKEVIDEFALDSDLADLGSTPTEEFSAALAEVSEKHRELLIEVARRSFRTGAKRGAIIALDAVIDGKIELDTSGSSPFLTTHEKALRVKSRTLTA